MCIVFSVFTFFRGNSRDFSALYRFIAAVERQMTAAPIETPEEKITIRPKKNIYIDHIIPFDGKVK